MLYLNWSYVTLSYMPPCLLIFFLWLSYILKHLIFGKSSMGQYRSLEMSNLHMEASQPKWVNLDYIQYGVNSLRLWALNMMFLFPCFGLTFIWYSYSFNLPLRNEFNISFSLVVVVVYVKMCTSENLKIC